jgi:hypothetical protein
MGAGKKKAHESFSVAPSVTEAPVVPEGLAPVTEADLDAIAAPTGDAAIALDAYNDALATATQIAESPDAATHDAYIAFKESVYEAGAHLEAGGAEGLPPQLVAEQQKALNHLSTAYLSGLELAELASLAAEEGFEHPTLVGLNAASGGAHPLVHWLDPAYPPTSPSKLAIQAKAGERYAALGAGETIGGLTLAQVQAEEAQISAGAPLPPEVSWEATPAQVVEAQAALHQALADFNPSTSVDNGLGNLVAAENHLVTAHCPELGPQLDVSKAAAKAAVDQAIGTKSYSLGNAINELATSAHEAGTFDAAAAKYLTRDEQLALLRLSTPASERAGLTALATERHGDLRKLAALKESYQSGFSGGAVHIVAPDDPVVGASGVVGFATTAKAYFDQRDKVIAWAGKVAGATEVTAVTGATYYSSSYQAQDLTKEFRAWAKGQKLAALRDAATKLGMPQAAGASRAQVQNYIAAGWDPMLDKAAIAAQVSAKAAPKPAAPPKSAPAAPKPTPSPATSAPTPPTPSSAVAAPQSPKSFAAKHLQIVESLKAHQAVAADLPARPPSSEVASWSFGPAKAAHLGGAHTKSLHTAPDGSVWMFKPDKTNAGARAHAEASASEVFTRVGVPSVAVYARSIEGKPGSIQPLVEGASTLSSEPKSWSQADVDNLVRYHVAAWAVGDHDGNAQNVIRTPSGGLCPVDQGQAFKFFGRDRLASDYHPNNSYGSVAVFHQAYGAAKSGQLAKGVGIRPEAALPTIKAFEAMPEAQYRALLKPVATEGAKHGVHWVEPMRAAAQTRLGKKQVSNDEVAEEFLRTAVTRKESLRADFAAFFAGHGFGGASKLEKVA